MFQTAGFLGCLAAALPAPAAAQDLRAWALGGTVFADAPLDHRIFDPLVVAVPNETTAQSGTWAEAGVAYSPGRGEIGLSAQGFSVDMGRSNTFTEGPEMGIEGLVVDLAYGQDLAFGGSAADLDLDIGWTIGLRHAAIDTEVDDFFSVGGPTHAFAGTGLRLGAQGSGRIGALSRLGWFGAGGLSILPGRIETTPRGGWFCDDCTDVDVTATGADLRLGLTYRVTGGLSLRGGYQGQLWRDVTVETSDQSGFGQNSGTSDLLVQGLFLGVEARW